jgi:hypothetical protein
MEVNLRVASFFDRWRQYRSPAVVYIEDKQTETNEEEF